MRTKSFLFVAAVAGLECAIARGETNGPEGALVNGDVNCDGFVDLADAVYILNWRFLGFEPPCPPADPPELVERLAELEAEVESTRTELVSCQIALMATTTELGETQTTLTNTVDSLLSCESNLEAAEAERDALAAQLQAAEEDLTATESALSLCDAELAKKNPALADCVAELSTTQALLADHETQLAQCGADLQGTLADLIVSQTALAESQGELSQCQATSTDLQNSLAGCQGDLDSCQDDSLLLLSTRQSECFDSVGSVIDCDNMEWPGQDGVYQRGRCAGQDRFVDNADDTVTDACTGLTWQKSMCSFRPESWQAALQYCEDLDLAGQTDWRLPNVRELYSLIESAESGPSPKVYDFSALGECNATFWSSTSSPRFGFTDAYSVAFTDGQVLALSKAFDFLRVRAVRGP